MKAGYVFLILFCFVVIVAVMTNPDKSAHKDVVKRKIAMQLLKETEEWQEKMFSDEELDMETMQEGLALTGAASMMEGIVDLGISVDNYVVFSLTKFTWEEESKIIGLGAFGNVILFVDLDQNLQEDIY